MRTLVYFCFIHIQYVWVSIYSVEADLTPTCDRQGSVPCKEKRILDWSFIQENLNRRVNHFRNILERNFVVYSKMIPESWKPSARAHASPSTNDLSVELALAASYKHQMQLPVAVIPPSISDTQLYRFSQALFSFQRWFVVKEIA